MAILKFELDTDDLAYDMNDGMSFDEIIKHIISDEVKKEISKKYSEEQVNKASKIIALECIHQIERKLDNLINEDVVITDRWGKPDFIGSAEDFIKKEIDNRMLKPVDSYGKALSNSCTSSDADTWLEYHIKDKIDKKLEIIDRRLDDIANFHCKKVIDEKIKNFKNSGLNELIMKRLEKAGVN